MPYLMRVNYRPEIRDLSRAEQTAVAKQFDPASVDVLVHRERIRWDEIEEVELATAPTVGGLSSWLLGRVVNTENRYHIGIYMGREEAVIANVNIRQATYVLHCIAYYTPQSVRYTGPDGIVPLTTG